MNCPTCVVGELKLSGSHEFCINCGFIVFKMTQDYIDVCAKVLGVLVSNTIFSDNKAMEEQMVTLIERHLPKLDSWLSTISNGYHELIQTMRDQVKAHAINLQIEGTMLNEEKDTSIVCRCGNKVNFSFGTKLTELECDECGAEFYAEPGKSFKPVFQCKCHSITYTVIDPNSSTVLVTCDECAMIYIKDDKVFIPVAQ